MEKKQKFSIWYVMLGIWVVLLLQNALSSYFSVRTIPYSEFLKLLKENKVTEAAIMANQIQGRLVTENVANSRKSQFKTVRVDPDISELLEEHNIIFKGQIESTFLRDLMS